MNRTAWHLRANAPAVFWLLALFVVSVAHRFLPESRWLLIHLLMLGAVTNSIMVWSAHFAEALLRTVSTPGLRRSIAARLTALNLGVATVVAGMMTGIWSVVLAGGTAVAGAAAWHGVALFRQARRALPSRFGPTVRYYVAAAALLPVGAALGVVLARGLDGPMHVRVGLAHAGLNVFGWVGLTVTGTLVTLWPTMLRTRVAEGAERAAQQALLVLVASLAVIVAGPLIGSRWATLAGVLGYLAGLVVAARPLVRAGRAKPPASFATWSVLAGFGWLIVSLVGLASILALAPSWDAVSARMGFVVVTLTAGFAVQVLLGALSYLVPVVLGGGPTAVRATTAVLDRGGALRVTLANVALVLSLLPVPSLVLVICTMLVLGALASFLPLLFQAVRVSFRVRKEPIAVKKQPATLRPGRLSGLVATAVAIVLIAVAGAVAADPASLGAAQTQPVADDVTPTGNTTEVAIEAKDMRFTPSNIEVPVGDRLVVEVTNTDDARVHDLVFESGQTSGRLAPGESATIDLGVIGRDLDGWCSVAGHRQMGMVLTVDATGEAADSRPADDGEDATAPDADEHAHHTTNDAPSATELLDLHAEPGPEFEPYDPKLAPASSETLHKVTFTVSELEREVAVGVTQHLWTFNGTAPGPTLRGHVGDTFEITLVNDGSIDHSIDFHAGALAPDQPMRSIPVGESLMYRFTATRSGMWMYHCSTMPMTMHIANGMFGAVIIDPPDLPPVDHEYIVVQSEYYLGSQGGIVDEEKLANEQPDLVVFNGYANQYDHAPLTAKVGDRVRIWVLAAGPNRGTSFHVVGGQFDTVFAEGAYLLQPGSPTAGGSQTIALAPAQGGFVELTMPEAGHYPFVNHAMIDAERGAHGIIEVTPR